MQSSPPFLHHRVYPARSADEAALLLPQIHTQNDLIAVINYVPVNHPCIDVVRYSSLDLLECSYWIRFVVVPPQGVMRHKMSRK